MLSLRCFPFAFEFRLLRILSFVGEFLILSFKVPASADVLFFYAFRINPTTAKIKQKVVLLLSTVLMH